MMDDFGKDDHIVILGLGKTGLSCIRYFVSKNLSCSVMDTREQPPGLQALRTLWPHIPVHTGGFYEPWMRQATVLIVSPGISLHQPEIAEKQQQGCLVIGDIELFCRAIKHTPIVAITGTNGKSTVTQLLGLMAQKAGINVGIVGNIGTPVLDDLCDNDKRALYILELSSFQLETTHSLRAKVATVLNITPDHMDRYTHFCDYQRAKHRIYHHCQHAVINQDDAASIPDHLAAETVTQLTQNEPQSTQWGITALQGEPWFTFGKHPLLPVAQMKLYGRHNRANVLAALALAHRAGIPESAAIQAIREFSGLAHRCQWVTRHQGIDFINDSKATNTEAALASIEGIGSSIYGKLVLILGGQSKGARFDALVTAIQRYARKVVVMGEEAQHIASLLPEALVLHAGFNLEQAVSVSFEQARRGDTVLLSPGCASFDMFDNFMHRGQAFIDAVGALANAP